MSVIDNVLISPALDYKQMSVSRPTYRFSRLLPNTGSSSLTVTSAGGQEILIEIPAGKAFNLSESRLLYSITNIATAGAAISYWYRADILPFVSQIQLYTRSGQYLCDGFSMLKHLT